MAGVQPEIANPVAVERGFHRRAAGPVILGIDGLI
jgi:hypothetical protein